MQKCQIQMFAVLFFIKIYAKSFWLWFMYLYANEGLTKIKSMTNVKMSSVYNKHSRSYHTSSYLGGNMVELTRILATLL